MKIQKLFTTTLQYANVFKLLLNKKYRKWETVLLMQVSKNK